jgi:alkanesulfonate monooxygenase SsuD/methylene tetrahydromethanopterin reductase-like flavin-dependent oxidoreductase (luciferase family)
LLQQRERVNPQYAIQIAEEAWGRDLSGFDPDGPLPDVAPERSGPDPGRVVRHWRELAAANNLKTLREVAMAVALPKTFVGSPQTLAEEINRSVQADACDGFILWPSIVPDGLDDFADKVVPLLVERGVFRAEYSGTTLREHLGLEPVRPGKS